MQNKQSSLALYTKELVAAASEGKLDPVLNRDSDIARVIRVLARRTKNNPVLVGPPGVGKTAIIEGLAQRVLRGDVTKNLKDCKIFSLDMGLLIAGASYQGQFEDRLKGLMKELKEQAESGNHCVLFIDEIHLVLGCGKTSGAMDAANIMKPELSRAASGLQVIGATTLEEYRQYIEKDAAFERRFQKVIVEEPSVADTISILRGLKEKYESHHGVRIKDSALVVAAQLADRYIQGRFQPDKSIDLLDEACAKTRIQLDSQPEILDQLERKKFQLEIEETALTSENDVQSKERLLLIREEIKKIDTELLPLKAKYENEKVRVDEIRLYQKKLDDLRTKMAAAERHRDLVTVADIQYYAIPEVKQKLYEAEERKKQRIDMGEDESMLSEIVGPEEIYGIVSNSTGIPVSKLNRSDKEKVLQLFDNITQKVIGQDLAVKAISEAILRSRSGINKEEQPIGSFLFLGPTGVGKTEISKSLALELFDDERHMIRIDMSEYMEPHSLSRLIGAPPGYIGYDEGGQLTEPIRTRPYNVVLFDEVEKAHPSILNILLQILDEGRLTDGRGRTVNFRNTIIILTSNIGSEYLISPNQNVEELVMQKVKMHFRPELLNRLDDTILFSPLSPQNLYSIVLLQIKKVAERFHKINLHLEATPNAIQFILTNSYDPNYGARPMRRFIEKNIVTRIGRFLLSSEISELSTIVIDVSNDDFVFHISNNKTN